MRTRKCHLGARACSQRRQLTLASKYALRGPIYFLRVQRLSNQPFYNPVGFLAGPADVAPLSPSQLTFVAILPCLFFVTPRVATAAGTNNWLYSFSRPLSSFAIRSKIGAFRKTTNKSLPVEWRATQRRRLLSAFVSTQAATWAVESWSHLEGRGFSRRRLHAGLVRLLRELGQYLAHLRCVSLLDGFLLPLHLGGLHVRRA